MPCYHPLPAWQLPDGGIVFWAKSGGEPLSVPCGQCSGCRLRRARHWATRCVHESQLHVVSCFLTLTYRDPCPVSLSYSDFQAFMHRLRKFARPLKVRFFACGEYGDLTFRPHFHACVFGFDFLDKKFYKTTDTGESLFSSAEADRLWRLGNVLIGAVTFQSASYVARYVMKKIVGQEAESYYRVVDPSTGEIFDVEPELLHMSLKPGIGSGWFEKFGSTDCRFGEVVVAGKKSQAPRYYDVLYERRDPEEMQRIKDDRFQKMTSRPDWQSEQSLSRLATQEKVLLSRLSQFHREV